MALPLVLIAGLAAVGAGVGAAVAKHNDEPWWKGALAGGTLGGLGGLGLSALLPASVPAAGGVGQGLGALARGPAWAASPIPSLTPQSLFAGTAGTSGSSLANVLRAPLAATAPWTGIAQQPSAEAIEAGVNASLGQPAVPGEPGGPQYSRRGLLEAAMRKARDPQTRQWLSDFLIRGGQQYSEDEQRRLLNEIYYTPQQRGGAYGAVGPDPLRRLTELSAIASRPL